ncbi:MFS transporter [Sphingomonas sp. MMS24-JH45]
MLFGWASDRSVARGGSRRPWLAAGAAATVASYAGVALAATTPALVAAIVLFQIAVNALLAPLMALMADKIPDAQKGVAGGLLALAAPVAAGASAALVALPALGEAGRLGAVALSAALVVPLLAMAPRRAAEPVAPAAAAVAQRRRDLTIAWTARLLVQVAGSALSLYLLYYFENVARGLPADVLATRVGRLLTLAYALPLPVAVAIGRWSSRSGRRRPFLAGSAGIAVEELEVVGMAGAGGWLAAATGSSSIRSGRRRPPRSLPGYAMQLLPSRRRRGRDLGLMNLANTLPSLVGPALTWWLAAQEDFDAVILTVAALTLAGGATILAVRPRD